MYSYQRMELYMNRKELEQDEEFISFLRSKYRYDCDKLWMFDESNSSPTKGEWRPVREADNGNGYLNVTVTYKKKGYHFFYHRLVFLLNNGYFASIIDHIDRNKYNNKIENLRAVNQSENCLNRKSGQNNKGKCPYLGVSYRADKRKYQAQIIVNHKRKYLGR